MNLLVKQAPHNGILAGPKNKLVFPFRDASIDYEITIEQAGIRQIMISSSDTETCCGLLKVFYCIETLLMLFDGQFYPFIHVYDNAQEVTSSFRKRSLVNYTSADFMIGSSSILVDYENILSSEILEKWSKLRDELDIIHNMVLYCLSSVQIPIDMKCAFMIESFLGVAELAKKEKSNIVLPQKGKKGESDLQKYLVAIIKYYGQEIFDKENYKDINQFAQILTNSRNRIAHIKEKQGRLYLSGEECVIYLSKLSLLYRIILFDLLGIHTEIYKEKLHSKINELNNKFSQVIGNFIGSKW